MEIEAGEIFADLWMPWIQRGGVAAVSVAAIAAGILKLRSSIRGVSSTQRLDSQIPQAMERALILSDALRHRLQDVVEDHVDVVGLKEMLHSKTLTKSQKLDVWNKLRVDALAGIVVTPYLTALVATTVAVRLSVTVVEHFDKTKKANSSGGEVGAAGGGMEGYLLKGLTQLLAQLGTSAFGESTTLGIDIVERWIGDQIETMFHIARALVQEELPDRNFGVANVAVAPEEIAAGLRRVADRFERSVDWAGFSIPPLQSIERGGRLDDSAEAEECDEITELAAEVAASEEESFEKLVLSHARALLQPVLSAKPVLSVLPSPERRELIAVNGEDTVAAAGGSTGSTPSGEDPTPQGRGLERNQNGHPLPSISSLHLISTLTSCKAYNTETNKGPMLHMVNILIRVAQQLNGQAIVELPPLTQSFCTQLIRHAVQ